MIGKTWRRHWMGITPLFGYPAERSASIGALTTPRAETIWPLIKRQVGAKTSIVGSSEAFYRVWAASAGWGPMISFIVAAVIGNAIGGVMLVAILNYGQVVTERKEKGQEQTEVAEKTA